MVESLPITKYNFSKNFPPHGTFCAIGRRGSGKSKCLIDVMYQLRERFDFGIAFTTTTPMAEALYEIMPRACVFKTFSTERIQLLLEEQERLIAKKKPRSLFLLLDDCGFDLKSMNSTPMKELFMNGRHKLVTFLCALQFPHQLKPDMRMQIDTVIALKENQVSNRKRIYEAFFGVISSWHDFERLFAGFTSDYGALVVDQTVQSNDITKVVFHYKACIELPPFVCISRKYIKIWENVKKSQAEVSRLREEQIVQQRRRQIAEAARKKGEKIRVTHTAVSANNGDPDSKIVVTN